MENDFGSERDGASAHTASELGHTTETRITGDDSREADSGREEGISLGWFVYCLPNRPLT